MMSALSRDLPNVTVSTWNGLIVDFADRIGVHVIVRGVRALADFDYEFELSLMNRSLNPRIETIFLPTDQKYSVIRSSAIKEIAGFGGDISGMVPPIVAKALQEKLHPARANAEPDTVGRLDIRGRISVALPCSHGGRRELPSQHNRGDEMALPKRRISTGKGTQATLGEHASRGSDPRRMQQLREQGHAAQGLSQMRLLQGKADPQAGRDVRETDPREQPPRID